MKNNFKNFVLVTFITLGIIFILSKTADLISFVFNLPVQDFAFIEQYTFAENILFVLILAPVLEEFVFRKVILNFLRRNFSDLIAVIVSSFIFAFFHFDILQGFIAFFFGIFLALIAIKTRSINLCIYAHFLNNLLFLLSINFFAVFL